MARDLAPLATPRARDALREAVAELYRAETSALAAALARGLAAAGERGDEARRARLAAAAEGAMEAATLLLERMLPQAVAPLAGRCAGKLLRRARSLLP